MEFVPGRFYRTRGGHKAMYLGRNPFASDESRCHVFVTKEMGIQANRSDGIYFHEQEHHSDIIGEWQEPVTVTRWWYAYIRPNGTQGEAWFSKRETAENDRADMASGVHCYRVGPIEQITTVVP